MSRRATGPILVLLGAPPIAVGVWIGLTAIVSRVCGTIMFVGYCGADVSLWLDLVVLPILVAVSFAVAVVRRTYGGVGFAVLLSIGSVAGVFLGGDFSAAYLFALATSIVGTIAGLVWVTAMRPTLPGTAA